MLKEHQAKVCCRTREAIPRLLVAMMQTVQAQPQIDELLRVVIVCIIHYLYIAMG